MFVSVGSYPSSARAWVAAANAIQQAGGETYNLILDIEDALAADALDREIINSVDRFLKAHHSNPVSSVANTIFPQALLERHGPERFYAVYRDEVFPRMKRITHDWGRYFERMTMWKKVRGTRLEIINPLSDLIEFMRRQIQSDRAYRHAYEMTIYDPARDAGRGSNRQCLSFLSFKLTSEKELLLTAVYRNHHYVSRALGNFIGLGRLQAFVAEQAGAKRGSLTCLATHAELDHHTNRRDDDVVEGWTSTQARELLDKVRNLKG